MTFTISHFLTTAGLILSIIVTSWNFHNKSIEQNSKNKELESMAKNNHEALVALTQRIKALESRDDMVVELTVTLKHVTDQLEKLDKKFDRYINKELQL